MIGRARAQNDHSQQSRKRMWCPDVTAPKKEKKTKCPEYFHISCINRLNKHQISWLIDWQVKPGTVCIFLEKLYQSLAVTNSDDAVSPEQTFKPWAEVNQVWNLCVQTENCNWEMVRLSVALWPETCSWDNAGCQVSGWTSVQRSERFWDLDKCLSQMYDWQTNVCQS